MKKKKTIQRRRTEAKSEANVAFRAVRRGHLAGFYLQNTPPDSWLFRWFFSVRSVLFSVDAPERNIMRVRLSEREIKLARVFCVSSNVTAR